MNNSEKFDVEKVSKHWFDTSIEDFHTMNTLYKNQSYGWALFLGHISVEKLLKAVYTKKYQKHAPLIHNLYRLAELSNLEIDDTYSDWLDEITSFNLNARYDDYKREFYNLCTKDFTEEWIEKIKVLRSWIEETYWK